MDFNELVNALWRRKFWIAAVSLGVVAAAYGALHVVKPKYEATTTVALATKNSDPNNFFFYTTMDSIVPVYADAVTARTTLNEAARRLGTSLADIRVQVFKSSPILRIKARSTKPTLAATSANAVASVLLDRVRRGEIGIPALRLTEVDRASIPEKPVFPDRPLTFIVAGLLGLALGVGAALMRENLATTIESGDDLARVAGIPSFGEIPQESAIARMGSVESLVDDPGLRVVSEAFRDVRTNLLFSERDLRSLVVTSPDGSHGKTTVAFGLAVTLARAGTRTVLVDADLRRGRLAEMLGVRRAPGLAELLTAQTTHKAAVRSTPLSTLDIITGGNRPADPGELLTVEFPAILKWLEEEYEMVIIDATPAVPVTDARVVARYADATVLVVGAGRTSRRQVRTAIERLALISVRPTATILNQSKSPRGSSYYIIDEQTPDGARTGRKREKTRNVASR